MFEAGAITDRAAAVAGIEAEGARRIAPLLGNPGGGELLADGVPGAHIADRVGAGTLADGGLVEQHHPVDQVMACDGLVCAGYLFRVALQFRQGVEQDVLYQGRLAGAGDAGEGDQTVERDTYVDVLQIVFAGAEDLDMAVFIIGGIGLLGLGDLGFTLEIFPGQGVSVPQQLLGGAVEDHLAAPFAGARADVEDAVGGEHDLRVVLHHQQGVAGVAQARQYAVDALDVPGVQADARLVEHEQGVDQGGAEGGSEVDTLHLAAGEGAGLAVQGQIAQAHIEQIGDAGADLVEQQVELLRRLTSSPKQPAKEPMQLLDRQLHQVVDVESRQLEEPVFRHGDAVVGKALSRLEHLVRLLAAAETKVEGLVLQSCALAVRTGVVAAVLGEHDPDVHLVGLALEEAEVLPHPVPGLAVPGPVALDDPATGLLVQIPPGGIQVHAPLAAVAHQVLLTLHGVAAAEGLDGAVTQGQRIVGDHQIPVDADGAAETAAGVAGAQRRVEGEEVGLGLPVVDVAVGAVQAAGELPGFARFPVGIQRIDRALAVTLLQGDLQRLHQTARVAAVEPDPVLHHFDQLLLLIVDTGIALLRQHLLDLVVAEVVRYLDGEGHHQAQGLFTRCIDQLLEDAVRGVPLHRPAAAVAVQPGGAGEEQLQVVVELGHGADGGAGGAHRVGLVDGDTRRDAVDALHLGPVHTVEELAGVGGEGLHVAALSLGVDGIEGE